MTDRQRDLCEKMMLAIRKYEDRKAYFDEVSAAYDRLPKWDGRRQLDNENRKTTDPRRIKAAKDAEWARSEAIMYAVALSAITSTSNFYEMISMLDRIDDATPKL